MLPANFPDVTMFIVLLYDTETHYKNSETPEKSNIPPGISQKNSIQKGTVRFIKQFLVFTRQKFVKKCKISKFFGSIAQSSWKYIYKI